MFIVDMVILTWYKVNQGSHKSDDGERESWLGSTKLDFKEYVVLEYWAYSVCYNLVESFVHNPLCMLV